MASDGEGSLTQSDEWCHHLDLGKVPVAAGAVEGGVSGADSCSGEDTTRGMLNRVYVGAFPNNRWYGVTIMPWPLGAGPKGSTAGGKEGKAVLSLLLDSLCLQTLDVFGMGLLG